MYMYYAFYFLSLSLFFSLLSRLALPICLNYLYIIQVVRLEHHEEDDQIPTTAFAEVSHALTTPLMTTPTHRLQVIHS